MNTFPSFYVIFSVNVKVKQYFGSGKTNALNFPFFFCFFSFAYCFLSFVFSFREKKCKMLWEEIIKHLFAIYTIFNGQMNNKKKKKRIFENITRTNESAVYSILNSKEPEIRKILRNSTIFCTRAMFDVTEIGVDRNSILFFSLFYLRLHKVTKEKVDFSLFIVVVFVFGQYTFYYIIVCSPADKNGRKRK